MIHDCFGPALQLRTAHQTIADVQGTPPRVGGVFPRPMTEIVVGPSFDHRRGSQSELALLDQVAEL